ncbi:DapH/DapD/GlmU-related protein [Kitasatospora sp. GAS204B]|uniref:acyltransferase n=1 Tax=unclassified Kitasatospora TaxID=2633591 RepID=UPI0024764277|nr:acyltransferase [Kitasatospora sp. GAS204B]MDH6122218.1 acetyltransferase-like isoleucine patch superfamily enzyme [Kitasatospora sp. GAS204B]
MPNAAALLTAVRSRARRAAGRVVHRGWRWVQETGAVTNRNPGPYRFHTLGDGSKFAFPLGTVFNEQSIAIGPFCIIGERVTISAGFLPGLDLGPEPVITIGGGCVIGRGSHLVGHQSIVLGDDVWTGPNVYISDQAHEYRDTTLPIGKQWPRNEPVEIGAGSWIGTGAVILPGARLGRNVVVAAGSVVRGEVPDHSVVAGAPARVVRSFTEAQGWQPPFRHDAPRPLPDGITAEQLRALVGWDLRPPTGS